VAKSAYNHKYVVSSDYTGYYRQLNFMLGFAGELPINRISIGLHTLIGLNSSNRSKMIGVAKDLYTNDEVVIFQNSSGSNSFALNAGASILYFVNPFKKAFVTLNIDYNYSDVTYNYSKYGFQTTNLFWWGAGSTELRNFDQTTSFIASSILATFGVGIKI
jgi:hypothetical protein